MGQGIYWVLRVPGFGYVKEEQFTGKFEYVANYKEATSFGRDTAIKMRSTKYIGAKLVKITQNGQKKSPLGRASASAPNKRRGFIAPPAPVATPKRITHVGICLDASGSMAGIANDVQKAVNDILKTIRETDGKNGLETDVSFWTFGVDSGRSRVPAGLLNANGVHGTLSHEVREDYFQRRASTVDDVRNYFANGMTPLADAVGNCIERLMSIPVPPGADVSYLVQCLTDGHENSSSKFTVPLVRDAVLARQATDRWTFAFMVPPGAKQQFMTRFGLPAGNVQEWEATTRGIREVTRQAVVGASAYMTSRSVGETKSLAYFEADLSKVNVNDLASRLTDVTNRVKASKVEKEVSIKDFIESKGEAYRKGDAFYPLTKKETVDQDKKILVQDKKTGRYYTGKAVRKILGLPEQSAKLAPGNMAWLNVYLQSTSDNRKLVRGTELVYTKAGQTLDV